MLIRGDCVGALKTKRKGSFRSPTLQDIVLRFQELFLDAGASVLLFLHAQAEVMTAKGVDCLSRRGLSCCAPQSRHTSCDPLWRQRPGSIARISRSISSPRRATTLSRFLLASSRDTRSQARRARTLSRNPAGWCRVAGYADGGTGSFHLSSRRECYSRPRSRNSARRECGASS